MDIRFTSKKVQKLCSSQKEMKKKLDKRTVGKLQQRLAELAAAESLEDLRSLPAVRCHELSQNRKGQLAVDLVHPLRLIFEPDHDPMPTKEDGGLNWSEVTNICIIEIVDYH